MESSLQTYIGLKTSDNQRTLVNKANSIQNFQNTGQEQIKSKVGNIPGELPSNDGKNEDLDETSSGYSSRESHCGHCREPVQSHRPERSSRNCAAENDSLLGDIADKKTPSLHEYIADERDPCIIVDNSQQTLSLLSKSRKLARQNSIELADKHKDETFKESNDTNRTLQESIVDKDCTSKEYNDMGTQTEIFESKNDEMITVLIEANAELQKKLKRKNNRGECLIENLERQLLTALTEITQLKAQLMSVEESKTQSLLCSKCGYLSKGDEIEKASQSKCDVVHVDADGQSNSVDISYCKSFHTQHSSTNLSTAHTVRVILKGKSPDDMKTTLLQRNRALRNEIETLKTKRAPSSTPSITAKMTVDDVQNGLDFSNCDIGMDKITTDEREKISQKHINSRRSLKEDVWWKQSQKTTGKQRCKNSTSQAFRTINVQTWGQTM